MKNRISFSRKLAALTVMSGLNVALSPISAALAAPPSTIRVSVSSTGEEANSWSYAASISGNGRFVSFTTDSSNLVEGDNNGERDVFVRDLRTGLTQRVSVGSEGEEASGDRSSISANGRFVAFYSTASNLVTGENDNNRYGDIYVHDLKTGLNQRVSVSSSGAEGNYYSDLPSISGDGRFVSFYSIASTLVEGDNNGFADIFVHDLKTGVTHRVSVDSSGAESNADSGISSISANGRFVAFSSTASNLVSGDNNGVSDVFVHDLKTGVTQRVSIDSSGVEGNSGGELPNVLTSISADGRFVAFTSISSNLVSGDNNGFTDVFVHDLKTGVTHRVSVDNSGAEGNGDSFYSTISANGRLVAFSSNASNLGAGNNNGTGNFFVHDLKTGVTQRVPIVSPKTEANGSSYDPSISANGRFVVFASSASNLVPGDNNGLDDIFVSRRW